MSNSVQPCRWQPTRLSRPWDSPGKNTGVGCHFLLQWMKAKSESEVAQSCPTLSDPMDGSPPAPLSMGFSRQEYMVSGSGGSMGKTSSSNAGGGGFNPWLLLLLLLSHVSRVRLCATPKTAAHQAPLSLGFSRQEHWSGLPFPFPMHESEKGK